MKLPRSPRTTPALEMAGLRARLDLAEGTLRAIGAGEVDTLLVDGKLGPQVFTLHGAEHAYRMLIESMSEGALTLTPEKTILYANGCFARMVHCPLEQVIGTSFQRFLVPADRAAVARLMHRARPAGSKIQVQLQAADGSPLPVQISLRSLARSGGEQVTTGVVVTDLSASQRSEQQLRELSHRLVQAEESVRGNVARELHDHITQLLCAVLVRCQTLADQLPPRAGPARNEALQLRVLLGQAAEEVERISRELRPGILEQLGLVAALQDTSHAFAARTGVRLKLVCVKVQPRLSPDIELTLYRILQAALQNVEQHARARMVSVYLTRPHGFVQLLIHDNGVGFNTDVHSLRPKTNGGLGLVGMRERAAYVGGLLLVKSLRRSGTEIKIRIPCPPARRVNLK